MMNSQWGWAALAMTPVVMCAAPAAAATSTSIVITSRGETLPRSSIQLFNAQTGAQVRMEEEDDDRAAALFLLDGGRYRVVVNGQTVREISVSGTGSQRFEIEVPPHVLAQAAPAQGMTAMDVEAVALQQRALHVAGLEDRGFYIGVGYSHIGIDFNDDDVDLGAVTGRGGYRFGRYVGIEGEASFGVADEDLDNGSFNLSVGLEHDIAGYVIGFLPLADNAEIFARAGYGSTSIEVSFEDDSQSEDDSALRYGVGGQLWFDEVNGVRAEFTRIDGGGEDDEGLQADIFSISYVRRFR